MADEQPIELTPPEPLYSRRDAHALGLKPRAGAVPVKEVDWKYGTYPIYRREDLVPLRKHKVIPAEQIDLLAAIFTVNRSAKRYRDTAASCYERGAHQFAGHAKETKEQLYRLKDRGIVAAFSAGRITPEGKHGALTVWRGEGYCFHSYLTPPGATLAVLGEETITVESKPKGKKEPRLCDAKATLESLPAVPADWKRTQAPRFPRSSRCRDDWEEDDWEDNNG